MTEPETDTSVAKQRVRGAIDDVFVKGAAELKAFMPSMLNHEIASMVFLPWLTRYTQGVRDVAKREERDLILSIPGLSDKAKRLIRKWTEDEPS
jgi:hypothetical protein